jgi:hypothetical protein
MWEARVVTDTKRIGLRMIRYVAAKSHAKCQVKLDDTRRRPSDGAFGDAAKERTTVAAFLDSRLVITTVTIRPQTHKRCSDGVRCHLTPGLGQHKLAARWWLPLR